MNGVITLASYYTKTEATSMFMRISSYTDIGATAENNVSLNTITTYGVYKNGSTPKASTYVTNRPVTTEEPFRLTVERSTYASYPYIRQRYQQYNSAHVYERYSNDTGATWSNWVLVQNDLANYYTKTQSDGRFVMLSGGTMTGGITMGADSSTMFNDKGILFGASGTYGRLSARSNGNVALCAGGAVYITPNSSSAIDTSCRLVVGASTFTYGGNTIWHAGNDGTGSGLDADLLDGTHKSGLFTGFASDGTSTKITIGGTAISLTIPYATEANRFLSAQILAANTSGDANTMQIDGAGTAYSVLTNYDSNRKWQNMPTFGTNAYGGVVEIKGNDSSLKMQFAWAAYHNNTTAPTNGLWYRARADKGYLASDWHKVAFTDSNVASATKLQTTRKLWGNDFDGTQDISSNIYMDNAKHIYAKDVPSSGTASNIMLLGLNASNSFLVGYGVGGAGYDTYLYGNNIYLRYGTSRATGILLNSSGNVGIGTTSPTSKLHVEGETKTNNLAISSTSAEAHISFARSSHNYIQAAEEGGNIRFITNGKSISTSHTDMLISDGAVSVTGTFAATGNSTIGGTLGVTGATTLNSTLGVTGAATLNSTLRVSGETTLSSTIYAYGTMRAQIIHPRTSNSSSYTLGSQSYWWSQLFIKKIYLLKPNSGDDDGAVYFEYDSNNSGVKLVGAGFYSDSYISAFGSQSGSSSLSLNGVLSSINSATSLAAPTSSENGAALVYTTANGWQYSTTSNTTLKADKLYASTGITISNGNLSISLGNISLAGKISAAGNLETGTNIISYNGKIAIGYSSVSSSYRFYCKDNGYISGTLTQGSDIRRKNINGEIYSLDVNDVALAPVFRFTWKDSDDKREYAGTSAQYWQAFLPQTVLPVGDGYLSMDYGVTALVATILTARKVVDHERRIKDLEAENERLRNEINELKAA